MLLCPRPVLDAKSNRILSQANSLSLSLLVNKQLMTFNLSFWDHLNLDTELFPSPNPTEANTVDKAQAQRILLTNRGA